MAVLGGTTCSGEEQPVAVVLPRHHSSSDGTTIRSRNDNPVNAGRRKNVFHPSDCKTETFATTRESNGATEALYSAILLHRRFRPTDG